VHEEDAMRALDGSGPAHSWLLAASAALLLACGEGSETPPVAAAPPAVPEPLSGLYEVSGVTVDKATGAERSVAGTLIVDVAGSAYTTTFDLATVLPVGGAPQHAELIGKGSGRVDDRKLEGTAETQLIVALVPGVDPGFGLLPRHATAQIANRSVAEVGPDGTVRIEIDSEAKPGTSYPPTHTRLRGRRVAAKGVEGIRAER
jgi:hypothetical protein